MALCPLQIRSANQHATKNRLVADEFLKAKRLPLGFGLVLAEKYFPRINTDQVLAIPPAVIVSLARQIISVPGRKIGIGQ